jgi:hypothetical protein
MQNRTLVPYLAAMNRIHIPVMRQVQPEQGNALPVGCAASITRILVLGSFLDKNSYKLVAEQGSKCLLMRAQIGQPVSY